MHNDEVKNATMKGNIWVQWDISQCEVGEVKILSPLPGNYRS